MRILIDLQGCQSGSRFGGIGRYSMSLVKAMLGLKTNHEFYLLLNRRLPNENFIRAEFADLMPQQNILTFDVPPYVAAENELPAHTRLAELIREKRIAEIDPDVLYIASLFEGAGEDVISSVGMLFPAERTAVTLYDLIPYLERETYLTNQMLSDHYLRKFDGLKRAGMIVSISAFSRAEALAHTDIPAGRIVNISSAVDSQFSPVEIASESKFQLLRNAGIEKPFLMFTGSFDVRKNHERLVKAFAKIPSTLRDQYQLVIIGRGEDRQIARLKAIAQTNGLNQQDLVFVGHVTDEDLVALYSLCTLFVFPSLREGFGLPVLEAMSCGAPTIGSNRTSVPEVIGRADALFDPEDVDDMAAKMASVLDNPDFRAELRKHGFEQAKNFSWELSAKRALEFFERALETSNNKESSSSQRSKLETSSSQRRLGPSPGHPTDQRPESVSTEWNGLDPSLRWDDGGDVEGSEAAMYDSFLDALSELQLGKLDDEFLESTARVIAANELLTRIECGDFRNELRIGRVSDLSDLQQALPSSPIDVVVIEHGHAMLDFSALAKLVTQQKALHRAVFVTLHSTADLQALTAETGMLEVRRALKSCEGIFVHAMDDVRNLEAFKVRKNVSYLPNPESKTQFDQSASRDQGGSIADYMLRKMAFAIAVGDW